MNAPQIIVLILYTLSLGMSIAKHGEPTKYNGWNALFSYAILMGLLFWGGFFK